MHPFDPERPLLVPLVYVAGPYTIPDPCENTHRAIKVANDLAESGKMVPVLPHLSHLWHTVTPRPYKFWTELDMHLLARCDAVFRIPGASSGADDEVAVARKLKIDVFTKPHLLVDWCDARLQGNASRYRTHGINPMKR